VPTDTFSITADANNGTAFWSRATYPPTTSTTTFGDESTDPSNVLFTTNGFFAPNFIIEEGFLRFDTSTLNSAAVISAANLILYCTSKVDGADNKSFVADYYDFGGTPVVTGDGIEAASPSIIGSVDLGTITTAAVNTFALTDLTGIIKSGGTNGQGFAGITGIRMTLNTGSPTVDNNVQFANLANANQEPRLEVTYTVPSTGANVAWIRA
jgi:hypothetical protein